MTDILTQLLAFAEAHDLLATRGALNVGLIISRRARKDGLPIDPDAQLSKSGGQVRGLSGSAGNAILLDYGVTRSIGTEVGRTNRGSIEKMRSYVTFLNSHFGDDDFDLLAIEKFWVDQFIARFARLPFRAHRDAGASIQQIVSNLIEQADQRQREMGGAMVTGTMLQHLVGAKLDIALKDRASIVHHGANANDVTGRSGDFDLGDAVIHVSTAPGDLLMAKCRDNLADGLKPMIVTTRGGVGAAQVFAKQKGDGLEKKLELFEIEQFVSINVAELGAFDTKRSIQALREIITRYNEIVKEHEIDPSMEILWG